MGQQLSSMLKKDKSGLSPVEQQLEESRLKGLLQFKVLLLGAGECGKSTVLKQVKLVHKIGFTDQEMRDFGVNLRRNTVQSIQVLIEACKTVVPPVPIEDPELQAHCEAIAKFEFENELCNIPPEIVKSIQAAWAGQPIKDVWERRTEFWCLDSIDYYFESVERFCEPDFKPDEQDCVMARIITTGIVTTEFENPPINFQLIDVGGQRNERRKWIHCFDDVTAIIYLVNLGGYASVLYEDSTVNRMHEDLDLFASTLNTAAFQSTPIYLIFNKKDLFESMLRKKPLTTCFPDYTGSSENVVEAIDFLTEKFRSKLTTNVDRLKQHSIAARFKRDVKTVWEDIALDLKNNHAKDIAEATRGLARMNKAKETQDKKKDKKKEGGTSSPIGSPRLTPKFLRKKKKDGESKEGDAPKEVADAPAEGTSGAAAAGAAAAAVGAAVVAGAVVADQATEKKPKKGVKFDAAEETGAEEKHTAKSTEGVKVDPMAEEEEAAAAAAAAAGTGAAAGGEDKDDLSTQEPTAEKDEGAPAEEKKEAKADDEEEDVPSAAPRAGTPPPQKAADDEDEDEEEEKAPAPAPAEAAAEANMGAETEVAPVLAQAEVKEAAKEEGEEERSSPVAAPSSAVAHVEAPVAAVAAAGGAVVADAEESEKKVKEEVKAESESVVACVSAAVEEVKAAVEEKEEEVAEKKEEVEEVVKEAAKAEEGVSAAAERNASPSPSEQSATSTEVEQAKVSQPVAKPIAETITAGAHTAAVAVENELS